MPQDAGGRKTVSLHQSVHHKLNVYALVACAAGVSVLALTSPSHAEVIYTPADERIGRDGSYKLDLNHDGIPDFIIAEYASRRSSGSEQQLIVRAGHGNHVNCVYAFCLSTFFYAAALFQGSQIGQAQQRHGWLAQQAQMAAEINGIFFDSWSNVSDRYLGLQFQINGEIHFGWARLNVRFHKGAPKDRTWEAELTGYAYETIPGKAITAGQTKDEAEDVSASPQAAQPRASMAAARPQPEPAGLGALSLGSSGLSIWRRP
jgi:hypothetical protein